MEQQPPSDASADQYTRMVLAGVITFLFVATTLIPYFRDVPGGQAGNLVVSGSKVVETVIVFVLGFYFGSTKDSNRKTDALIAANKSGSMGSQDDGSTLTRSPAGAKTTVEPVAPPALEEPEDDRNQ